MSQHIAFKDQYKHPLWQKKRLEALEAYHFACQRCYDGESTLHVHHKLYVKGRKIWEYDISELSVLCECCHGITHEAKDALNDILANLHAQGFEEVVALIAGFCSEIEGPAHICGIDEDRYSSFSQVAFIAGRFAAKENDEIVRQLARHERGV